MTNNIARFPSKVAPVKAVKVSLESHLKKILGDRAIQANAIEEKLKEDMQTFAEKHGFEFDDEDDLSVSLVSDNGVLTVYGSLNKRDDVLFQAVLRAYAPTRLTAGKLETSIEKAIASLASVADPIEEEDDESEE